MLHVFQAGLISLQPHIPEHQQRGWQQVVGSPKRSAGLRSHTSHASGIPHAGAGDVLSALLRLAKPPHPQLTFTLSELKQLMPEALHPQLDQVLQALINTRYTLWDSLGTTEMHFGLLHALNSTPTHDTEYTVVLSDHLLHSLPLNELFDPQRATQLPNSMARNLYRYLESIRGEETSVTLDVQEFISGIRLLGSHHSAARILDPFLRAEGHFDQLQDVGYLRSVHLQGRGWQTRLRIQYVPEEPSSPDEVQVALLNAGMPAEQARPFLHLSPRLVRALLAYTTLHHGGDREALAQLLQHPAPAQIIRHPAPLPPTLSQARARITLLSALHRITLAQAQRLHDDLNREHLSPGQVLGYPTLRASSIQPTL